MGWPWLTAAAGKKGRAKIAIEEILTVRCEVEISDEEKRFD